MINFKKITSLLLTVFLFASCGESVADEEEIVLLDPVSTTLSYYEADYRNLYDSKVYSSLITPAVTEYSFSSGINFYKYGAVVGDEVKNGTTLVKGNTESIDKQIETLTKSHDTAKETCVDTLDELNESLSEAEFDVDYYGKIVGNFESMNEEEKASYGNFSSEYAKYDYLYRDAILRVQSLNEQIKETTELYELDKAYNESLIKNLNSDKGKLELKSDIKGTVVAMTYLESGEYINRNRSVTGVADLTKKEVKVEYISKSVISNAADCFAIVNGKRYEVEYEGYDSKEYLRLSKLYDTVYGTFTLKDEAGELNFGDFVTIVIISDERENVLSVPTAAINKDDSGKYVYILDDDGNRVYTQVKTGMSDGLFTEILSGLDEGDKISTDFTIVERKNTYTLTKGTVGKDFEESGYLYYPRTEWVTNPIEYGTAYIDEICVSKNEMVEKGQVLCKIHVEADEIELKRQERALLRLNEELTELLKDEEKNEKAIKYKREAIADKEEYINDLKSDAAVTEIRAKNSGVVVDLKKFEEGDILMPDVQIAELSDGSSSYILLEDSGNQLTYGNEVTITYNTAEKEKKEVPGKVVTVSNYALTPDLQSDMIIVSIDEEYIGDMAASSQGGEGWWNMTRFTANAVTRTVDDVILIPRRAVKEADGCTYVTVKDEDGKLNYVSFISGGSDSSNYWCVKGLTEGMEICLD